MSISENNHITLESGAPPFSHVGTRLVARDSFDFNLLKLPVTQAANS